MGNGMSASRQLRPDEVKRVRRYIHGCNCGMLRCDNDHDGALMLTAEETKSIKTLTLGGT
jgi:hypothetical protein